jgi:transcriptional regulator with XRE-family HTH domain
MHMNYHLFRVRLRTARLRANLSQEALAAKAQMQQPYVYALEWGSREQLRAETLLKLARALGVSAVWLAGDD